MGHPILSKTCLGCGEKFLTREKQKKYCSAMCEEEADPDFKRQYNLKADMVCRMCGKHFMQEHFNQIYCSDECRRKAIMRNKKKYYAEICDE